MKNQLVKGIFILFTVVCSLLFILTCSLDGDIVRPSAKGEQDESSKDNKDGINIIIEISEDGYWVINGEKTDVKALGEKGEDGTDGKDGEDGKALDLGFTLQVVNSGKTAYLCGDGFAPAAGVQQKM